MTKEEIIAHLVLLKSSATQDKTNEMNTVLEDIKKDNFDWIIDVTIDVLRQRK